MTDPFIAGSDDIIFDAGPLPDAVGTPEGVVSASPGEPTELSIRGPGESVPEPMVTPVPSFTASPHEVITRLADDPHVVDSAEIIGFTGKLPIKNIQGVDNVLRLKTQLFFDDPNEKMAYLSKELGSNYVFKTKPDAPDQIILKQKNDKFWQMLDPAGLTPKEALQEIAEHATDIAEFATIPESWITGGLVTGGIESARQGIKKYLSPESKFDLMSVGIHTTGGAVGGGIGKIQKRMNESAAKAAEKAAQTMDAAEMSGMAGIIAKGINKGINYLNSPEFVSKEIGATGKQFNDFQKKTIQDSIKYLQENVPEFTEVYTKGLTLEQKKDGLQALLNNIGERIDHVYDNPDVIVSFNELINTDNIKLLKDAISTRRIMQNGTTKFVDADTAKGLQKIYKDYLERFGSMTLEQDGPSKYMKAFRSSKLHKMPELRQFKFKNSTQALETILADQTYNLKELASIRYGLLENVKFGKKVGQISHLDTAQKYAVDSATDVATSAIRKYNAELVKAGQAPIEDLAKLNLDYTNLVPVVATISGTVGKGKAASFQPFRWWPGKINTPARAAAKIGQTALQQPAIRSYLRIGIGANGLATPLPSAMADLKAPSSFKFIQRALRGGGYLRTRTVLENQATLPRDIEQYMQNPELLNRMGELADPETAQALYQQISKGDTKNAAHTLSLIASANAEEFDPAPYNSLTIKDGEPIITDPYERTAYRDFIDKADLPTAEKYKILNDLNKYGKMGPSPFNPPEMDTDIVSADVQDTSTVSRVAKALRHTETVELTGGEERQDYSY